MKSVQIESFLWFVLNTRKYGPKKTPFKKIIYRRFVFDYRGILVAVVQIDSEKFCVYLAHGPKNPKGYRMQIPITFDLRIRYCAYHVMVRSLLKITPTVIIFCKKWLASLKWVIFHVSCQKLQGPCARCWLFHVSIDYFCLLYSNFVIKISISINSIRQSSWYFDLRIAILFNLRFCEDCLANNVRDKTFYDSAGKQISVWS